MATLATATEKKAQMNADEKPERKPQRGRVDDKFKIFCGTANEPLCDEVCEFLGLTRGQALVTRFNDGEAYVQIQENVRGADVFVTAADLPSGGRAPDGVAADDRRAEAGVGAAHHGGDSVFRLCPAGPQGQAAGADFVQAGGRFADHGGRRPGADRGSARAADAGIFQYSGGPSVCVAGAGGLFQAAEPAQLDGGFAGCGRRGARPVFCQENGRRPGHRRQAPRRR